MSERDRTGPNTQMYFHTHSQKYVSGNVCRCSSCLISCHLFMQLHVCASLLHMNAEHTALVDMNYVSSAWAVLLTIIITAFLIRFTTHLFYILEILSTVGILRLDSRFFHGAGILVSFRLIRSFLPSSVSLLALPAYAFASLLIPVITLICVRTFTLTSLKKQPVGEAWLGKDGWWQLVFTAFLTALDTGKTCVLPERFRLLCCFVFLGSSPPVLIQNWFFLAHAENHRKLEVLYGQRSQCGCYRAFKWWKERGTSLLVMYTT